MTTRERLVAIIDKNGGMLRHCDERTSKALKSFYNALFMLADSIDGKTEEIRGNQEKISPNFKIEKGKMYRCIHSIDTFEKDHIYQSYEDGWIKNDDDNHVIAYSKYFCPVSEEKPESAFEAAIQPGDKIVFNKDMDCRVNLSQLDRVAKKEPRQENSPVLSNSLNTGRNEQKPADKVEPKFKVGDWLVHKNLVGITCCITQIHTPHYYLTNNNSFIKFGEEDNYRQWTIKDAKDGDVLCCESGWTCLFKALDNHTNTFSSYCFMDSDKWFCNTGSESHTLDKAFIKAYNGEIYPATKEQCDLLFKKMKEAGYEWDAEKKELRKIEQKPDKWSDEDEDYYDAIIAKLEVTQDDALLTDNQMRFLKSLKDRYTWKPSESDIRILEQVIDGTANPINYHATLYAILEKLKKLRED